ncbi:hypothetical protein OAJ05_01795 [Verrucomicrobia bacterium]|nr:hypothetical protein [bacterium]MDC0187920.1 hypothetical protein [Verrucomicrobiota bacterium]|tara:strand:- start:1023 stop:1388 length:366 start_codon:yes stop_codon:yes gene_type:complete
MRLTIEAEVTLTGVFMEKDQIILNYEGEIGKYGHVFFNHKLTPSDPQETKGSFTGFARTVLNDGGSIQGTLSGVWKRSGPNFRIHSLDDAIGIEDQNYVEITVDIITKNGSLKLFNLYEHW